MSFHRMPHESKQSGRLLYREKAVVGAKWKEDGTNFRFSVVADGISHTCYLTYTQHAWTSSCSCGKQPACQHQAAAYYSLLHDDVTKLEGAVPSGPPPPPKIAKPGVDEILRKRLGRELKPVEEEWARKIRRAYRAYQDTGTLSALELVTLGLLPGNYRWHYGQALDWWPDKDQDEWTFWVLLLCQLRKNRAPVPSSINKASESPELEAQVLAFQRQLAAREWIDRLRAMKELEAEAQPARDFRIEFREASAILWQRTAPEGEFSEVKSREMIALLEKSESGAFATTRECALLWGIVQAYFSTQRTYHFDYSTSPSLNALRQILLLPNRSSLVVQEQGKPHVWQEAPLRWQVRPPSEEDGDYAFALVDEQGEPVKNLYAVIPGRPCLYVTRKCIYEGPRPHSALPPKQTTLIPADAIRTSEGLRVFQVIGQPPPEELSSRIEKVRLGVRIQARLEPASPVRKKDRLAMVVTADSEQTGILLQTFIHHQWCHQGKVVQSSARVSAPGRITLHDRSLLNQVPELLENLKVAPEWPDRWVRNLTPEVAEQFVQWTKSLPEGITLTLDEELTTMARDPVRASLKLECEEKEIDWFDVRVELTVEDTDLTKEELETLLKAKGAYVRLAGKGWRRMQVEMSDEEDAGLARLGLSTEDLSTDSQTFHVLQLADPSASRFLREEQCERIQRRVSELKTRVNPPLPDSISASMRPYQTEGFHFLAYLATNRFGGILADDMGLGKTLQTLSWLAWLRDQSGDTPPCSLVVCPKSVMDNWRAEAARFYSSLRIAVWSGGDVNLLRSTIASCDLLVINYAQLREFPDVEPSISWLAVVLDEGQYIKNPSSVTAQCARALKANHRLVLTGTPIENRLMDLWSLMAFAMPGMLGNRTQFGRRYSRAADVRSKQRLAARLRPFLLRRTKTQVAPDLPGRIEEDLYCEMEGVQKNLYLAELKVARQALLNIRTQKELKEMQFQFLVSMLRLRQICCHPALYEASLKREPSAKMEALLELLEPLVEEGNKVLIFSQFLGLIDLLRAEFEKRGWAHFVLIGETENRGQLVQSFQDHQGSALFLISLKAGGFGLNLTAASYVVLFDPWWNPAVEAQAIDRTHRIGQSSTVIAYRLLVKNSIEEKIRHLQAKKAALVKDVLGEEGFASQLTIEDLKFVFSGPTDDDSPA
jgi:SNF2 family DNA or RNA helicase